MLRKRIGLIGAAAGLAAGVGLVKAVIDYRKAREQALSPPAAPPRKKQSQTGPTKQGQTRV